MPHDAQIVLHYLIIIVLLTDGEFLSPFVPWCMLISLNNKPVRRNNNNTTQAVAAVISITLGINKT